MAVSHKIFGIVFALLGVAALSSSALGDTVTIEGKLILPGKIGKTDWSRQRGNLQTYRDPQPWPAGLSIEERRKWLEETPEGQKASREHRSYRVKIAADGSYRIGNVAPGQYCLSVPLFSEHPHAENGEMIGVFQKDIDIPPFPGTSNFSSTDIQVMIDPPFYRRLTKGDILPDFTAEDLSGKPIESLRGKPAIVVFYEDIPEQFPALSDDIHKAVAEGKGRNIRIVCISTDDEKAMAVKLLRKYPLSCPVAWMKEDTELLKKFGPVWSPAIFAVNADGSIRGLFEKATDALADFAP